MLSWLMVASRLAKVIFPEPLSVMSTIARKSPAAIAASVVSSFRSTVNVRLALMSPPPERPTPAVSVTAVWSMCSLVTKFVPPS